MNYSLRNAIISPDHSYRYSLTRVWDPTKPLVMWIGLNPSTADALEDDPTIRKMVGFADRWGAGAIDVHNLFAWRSTDPHKLAGDFDPIGPLWDAYFGDALLTASKVVMAWGAHPLARTRASVVRERLAKSHGVPKKLFCLGTNADGSPKHPLYLSYKTPIVEVPHALYP